MPTLLAVASPKKDAGRHLIRLIHLAANSPDDPVTIITKRGTTYGRVSSISIAERGDGALVAAVGKRHPIANRTILIDQPARAAVSQASTGNEFPNSLGRVFGVAVGITSQGLVAARDSIGSRPLFLSRNGGEVLSSDPHALKAFGGGRIEIFPAHTAQFFGEGRLVRIPPPEPPKYPGTQTAVELLRRYLASSLDSIPIPRAVFFSGGIDSLILAKISEELGETVLLVAGIEGSKDISRAESAARQLKSPLEKIVIHPDELEDRVRRISEATGATDPLRISITIPLAYAAQRAAQIGITSAACGQGADELFGGYMKYLNSAEPQKHMYNDLLNIGDGGLVHCDLATRNEGVDIFFPFLDERVVALGLSAPMDEKIFNGARKVILRRLALHLGINRSLAQVKKCAMQYGSGVNKYVLRIVRKHRNGSA